MGKNTKNKVYKLERSGLQYVIMSSLDEVEKNIAPLIVECLRDAEVGDSFKIKVVQMTTKQLEELPEIDE